MPNVSEILQIMRQVSVADTRLLLDKWQVTEPAKYAIFAEFFLLLRK